MINPFEFTHRVIKTGYQINLDSHQINQINSEITVSPISEKPHVGYRLKKMANVHAGLITQSKFKNQTVLSARFDKQDADDRVIEEVDLHFNLNLNRNLAESDIDFDDFRSQL